MENQDIRNHLKHFGLYIPKHPEMGSIVHNLAELKQWRLDPSSRAEFREGKLELEMKIDLSHSGKSMRQMGVAFSRTALDKIVEQLQTLQRDVRHPIQRHESELRVLIDSITRTRAGECTPSEWKSTMKSKPYGIC